MVSDAKLGLNRAGPEEQRSGANMMRMRIPSLIDLCVNTAIDNVKYLGDVGETDLDLLDRILSHCNVDQLRHVEKSTKGRDLSPVTDKYWKKFYERKFTVENAKLVIERMRKKKVDFTWMKLFEAKEKEVAKAQEEAFDRIAKRYKDVDAKKQSRQVQICTKVPPSSKRSFFGGGGPGYNISNKSNIMKKAKIDFLKSNEVKNLTAMKRNAIKPNHSAMKLSVSPGKTQASTSKQIKPASKRF